MFSSIFLHFSKWTSVSQTPVSMTAHARRPITATHAHARQDIRVSTVRWTLTIVWASRVIRPIQSVWTGSTLTLVPANPDLLVLFQLRSLFLSVKTCIHYSGIRKSSVSEISHVFKASFSKILAFHRTYFFENQLRSILELFLWTYAENRYQLIFRWKLSPAILTW